MSKIVYLRKKVVEMLHCQHRVVKQLIDWQTKKLIQELTRKTYQYLTAL